MNRNYGKPRGENDVEYAPDHFPAEGIFNPLPETYHERGWYTLRAMSYPVEPAGDKKHWERDGFDIVPPEMTRRWKAVDDPPVYRRFSTLKIETNLLRIGKLDKLDKFLDETIIPGSNYALRRFYARANNLSEDHPMFAAYYASALAALEMTEAEGEQLLADSIWEY